MTTSAEDLNFYRENGYLAPVSLFGEEDAKQFSDLYRDCFDGDFIANLVEAADLKKDSNGDFWDDPHLLFQWAAELVFNPILVGTIRDILGPNVLVWESRFFAKKAHSSNFISWHQDLKYWQLNDSCEEVTAWIALTPSTEESGCMRVVPGSHKLDLVDDTQTFADENMLSRGQEVAVDVDEDEAVNMALKPGEMSLHHGKIFHASHPNKSDQDRIGLAVRCLPTSAQQTFGRGAATLLCGSCTNENFELLEPATDNNPTPARIRELAKVFANFGNQLAG